MALGLVHQGLGSALLSSEEQAQRSAYAKGANQKLILSIWGPVLTQTVDELTAITEGVVSQVKDESGGASKSGTGSCAPETVNMNGSLW